MVKMKSKKRRSGGKSLLELDADSFMSSFAQQPESKPSTTEAPNTSTKKKKSDKQKTSVSQKQNGNSNLTSGSEVKEGLSNLKEKDAEFFKFLQENDPELLNFSGDDSNDDVSSVEGGSEDEVCEVENDPPINMIPVKESSGDEADDNVSSPAEITSVPVTKLLLRKWERGLERNSLVQWKQLVRAFQAAVATARGDDEAAATYKYSIIDPDMINRVILLALHHSVEVLTHNLGDAPSSSEKWPKVKVTLKTYLGCLTDLLGLLTSSDVLCAVMRHCKSMLPFFVIFSRHVKKYVKGHVQIWGSKAELSKVVALTGLQALVQRLPSFLEDVIKKMYAEYSKCSKAMNIRSRDSIILMRNCLVEMFKINPSITYNTGFLSIRELAVSLRSAIMNKKKSDNDGVYNWQYVNALHVWVAVLSDCDPCLSPLIYPVIQVMFGVLKLHSSPCYHPLQLHIIRLMLHLGQQTNKHIPLIHPLLGILEFCSTQTKAAATKPIDLTCVLKVTKGYKKTKAYQDGIFDLTYELLLNYTSQLSRSISFPEVSFPISVWLKKFVKKCDNGKYKSLIKQLLEKIDAVSKDLSHRRSTVTFSPKDFKEVDAWEASQPETSLTVYFNTWLKLHRDISTQNNHEMEHLEDSEEDSKLRSKTESESDLEEAEKEATKTVSLVKTTKNNLKGKKRKLKTKSNDSNEKVIKTAKSKKAKDNKLVVSEDFADTGDIVEDIVLSD